MAPKDKNKSQNNRQEPQRLVRVTISVSREDYNAFDRLGEDARLSKSWLIRKAMREFLDRNHDSTSVEKALSRRN